MEIFFEKNIFFKDPPLPPGKAYISQSTITPSDLWIGKHQWRHTPTTTTTKVAKNHSTKFQLTVLLFSQMVSFFSFLNIFKHFSSSSNVHHIKWTFPFFIKNLEISEIIFKIYFCFRFCLVSMIQSLFLCKSIMLLRGHLKGEKFKDYFRLFVCSEN